MTRRLRLKLVLLAVLGAAVAVSLAALASAADAAETPWGELNHFALSGVRVEAEHAFVVDPATGDMFIVEPKANSEEFLIREFGPGGEALASATVTPKEASPKNPEEEVGIEGVNMQVAVDPARHRLFVLFVYERRGEYEEGGKAKEPLDPERPAAGELYGFSTETGEHQLKPLDKTGSVTAKGEPLTGEAEFKAQGETQKEALLNPRGIAVDPTTGNVVIAGQQDKNAQEEYVAAVQVVEMPGGAIGKRFVDKKDCLEGGEGSEACEQGSVEEVPFSPVVTPGGRIYVGREDEVWEIPTNGKSISANEFETAPKRLFVLANEAGEKAFEELLSFPENTELENGGLMTFLPEGAEGKEGRFYIDAGVAASPSEARNSAVLALHYKEAGAKGTPEATDFGWTGGGNHLLPKCGIPIPPVAGVVGATSAGPLLFIPSLEKGKAEIVRFGPKGEGCPVASAGEVLIEKGAAENVSELGPNEPATLRSKLATANATRVVWKFRFKPPQGAEESEPDVETKALQLQPEGTKLPHEFKHIGEYTITEEIETDDLATPSVVQTRRVHVGPPPLGVTISEFAPAAPLVGEAVKFTATVVDKEGRQPPTLAYTWEFGDGSTQSGSVSSNTIDGEHVYSGPCFACEVRVTVTDTETDAFGAGKTEVTVSEPEQQQPPPDTGGSTGGNNGGSPGGTSSASSGGNTGGSTGGGGVQAFAAAHLAGRSVSVAANGGFTIKVSCPAQDQSCSGSVTLRTAGAVSAKVKKSKKAILVLARGSFSLSAGQSRKITLHLSAKARKLLKRVHVLKAKATLVSHGPAGDTRTTSATVTLRLAKRKKH
jgi:hypothetical protein